MAHIVEDPNPAIDLLLDFRSAYEINIARIEESEEPDQEKLQKYHSVVANIDNAIRRITPISSRT